MQHTEPSPNGPGGIEWTREPWCGDGSFTRQSSCDQPLSLFVSTPVKHFWDGMPADRPFEPYPLHLKVKSICVPVPFQKSISNVKGQASSFIDPDQSCLFAVQKAMQQRNFGKLQLSGYIMLSLRACKNKPSFADTHFRRSFLRMDSV